MAKELTVKQRRFVEAYTGEAMGNATEAARLAGYGGGERSLITQGNRLLTYANIKSAVMALQKRESKRARKTRDDILAMLEADMDESENKGDRHRAIDLWNKMQGTYNHVQRVEYKDMSEADRAIRIRELALQIMERSD